MIEIEELRKTYGDHVALDGVSLTAPGGSVYGLLGPNGAGKSTLISCVAGLLVPSSGRVRVRGHDVVEDARAARRDLGLVPQEVALYEEISARENLRYWASAYGLGEPEAAERVEAVLRLTGLADRADEPVEQFSGGMKRRLNFGCGIVHRPAVLLLDEPTAGVDPQSRVRLHELVRREADAGTCVLYTTHYMEEAEELCDRLAIIDDGRLVAEGTLEDLRSRAAERDLLRLRGEFDGVPVEGICAELDDVEVVKREQDRVIVSLSEGPRRLAALLSELTGSGAEVRETTLTRPSLESLFIELTGRELRD